MPARHNSGFTLIELMVVIGIVAILLAIALPSFQGTLRSNRVATATNELIASLALARSDAIRSTRGAGVCPSADGATCGDASVWSQGWLVWGDSNGDGILSAGETVLRYSKLNPKLTATATGGAVIAFDPRGLRMGGAAEAVTLQPDECGGQPLSRAITVSATGQAKVAKGACK